ncbi:MAG: aminopeptidase [Bacilli bacterium]|nr:aminopeptidase [Bacilli bacterium]
MKEKYYKYAELLLKKGLCIKKKQPLVISAPIESIDFIRVLTEVACKLNVNDIYYDWYDDELKYTELKYYNIKDIKNSLFWNKKIHNEYAKKNAAFLFLTTSTTDIMKDIDPKKMKVASSHSLKTRNIYRKMQQENKINWCIAAVSTESFGKTVFNNEDNPKEKLWNTIFDICLINKENPIKEWEAKIKENKRICQKLTKLNIKTLIYTNKLGTNLKVELSKNAIWCGGNSNINNKELLVNIPSEEVFTTPNKYKTNGVVYCSKPLIHSGIMINDIFLEFKNGKVVNYDASSGKEELKNIIEFDSESSMLGEIALVDYNSKISNTNILFYETLFDENASCHIALGQGFKECLKNSFKLNNKELEKLGYNQSKNHIDIMIGTKDLDIKAITYDNKEIDIFKNGSFNI